MTVAADIPHVQLASHPASRWSEWKNNAAAASASCMLGGGVFPASSLPPVLHRNVPTDIQTPYPVGITDKSQVSPNSRPLASWRIRSPTARSHGDVVADETETPPGPNTSNSHPTSLARTASRMARMYLPCHAMPCHAVQPPSPVHCPESKRSPSRGRRPVLARKPSPVSTKPRWGCERSGGGRRRAPPPPPPSSLVEFMEDDMRGPDAGWGMGRHQQEDRRSKE